MSSPHTPHLPGGTWWDPDPLCPEHPTPQRDPEHPKTGLGEGEEGWDRVGAFPPAVVTFSPGVTEILQTQCMWAEYPLGNSGEEKLPWLSWSVSPQAVKGQKRPSDPSAKTPQQQERHHRLHPHPQRPFPT